MKLAADLAVPPAVVTVKVPLVARGGMVTVSEEAEAEDTTEDIPLILTVLFAGVVLKFAPVMATEVPAAPPSGEKFVITGIVELPGGVILNTTDDVAEPARVATEMLPSPVGTETLGFTWPGTVTVIEVGVAAVTVAGVPSK